MIDDDRVLMGGEPVFAGAEPVGYVTSAGWGASVRKSITYAWVPADLEVGTQVDVHYFERELPGSGHAGASIRPRRCPCRPDAAGADSGSE